MSLRITQFLFRCSLMSYRRGTVRSSLIRSRTFPANALFVPPLARLQSEYRYSSFRATLARLEMTAQSHDSFPFGHQPAACQAGHVFSCRAAALAQTNDVVSQTRKGSSPGALCMVPTYQSHLGHQLHTLLHVVCCGQQRRQRYPSVPVLDTCSLDRVASSPKKEAIRTEVHGWVKECHKNRLPGRIPVVLKSQWPPCSLGGCSVFPESPPVPRIRSGKGL